MKVDLTINTDLARKILTGFIHSEITRAGFSRAVINLSGGIEFGPVLLPGSRSLRPRKRTGDSPALPHFF